MPEFLMRRRPWSISRRGITKSPNLPHSTTTRDLSTRQLFPTQRRGHRPPILAASILLRTMKGTRCSGHLEANRLAAPMTKVRSTELLNLSTVLLTMAPVRQRIKMQYVGTALIHSVSSFMTSSYRLGSPARRRMVDNLPSKE